MCSKKWISKILAALVVMCSMAAMPAIANELPSTEGTGRGGDFTLHSFDGPVSLKQFRGKVVLLFFGYTSCPDVCPLTLSVLSKVFSKLSADELERVTALFVSLDPDRDTLELLRKYTGYFHPNIVGVTDRKAVIDEVTEKYGVVYERVEKSNSPIGYVILHTLDMLVVDGRGELLDTRISPTTSVEDIAEYVKDLLGSNS
jgi:protein SCO1/2